MSRRRAHIAMGGVPIVSHVLPSLALIRELVARGHRVTYANDPFVPDQIESADAELVPCTSTLPVADNDWPADPIAAASLFLDDAVQALPQLRAAYDHDPADLYLYDIGAYAARALGEAQGRPLVQLSPTFVGWDGYQEEVAAHLRKLPGADAYRDRFARWLADCDATTTNVDAFSGPPARALALIPRAMQPPADRVDTDTVTFVGPCLDTRADTDGWTRPAAADNVLLISLGSAYTRQPAFYRQCIAAFGDLPGRHVALQIGKYTVPEELGTLPSNVEVHSWVPQRAILEQSRRLRHPRRHGRLQRRAPRRRSHDRRAAGSRAVHERRPARGSRRRYDDGPRSACQRGPSRTGVGSGGQVAALDRRDERRPAGGCERERRAVRVLAVPDRDGGCEVVRDLKARAAVLIAVAALAPSRGGQVDRSHGSSSNTPRVKIRDSAGESARSRVASYTRCTRSTAAFSSMRSPPYPFSV